MTFAVLGRCPLRGQSGVAITTSSIAIGARCPFVRAGVGAASTQNVTDPRLGPALLDHMEAGETPEMAMEAVTTADGYMDHRQLLAINLAGQTAHFTGTKALGRSAAAKGLNCVAAGNLLANDGVPQAMVNGFSTDQRTYLADHLLAGLAAGLAAGGEVGSIHSAALQVAGDQDWPIVNLRVDWTEGDPIAELEALWQMYVPQMEDYVTRALDPDAAPSYGVPGDE